MIDNYVLDLVKKKISFYDEEEDVTDAFLERLSDIQSINIEEDDEIKGERIITIKLRGQVNPVKIRINQNNSIVGYEDIDLEEIGDGFMRFCSHLRELNTPNVRIIGDDFLHSNHDLKTISLPKVVKIGNSFMMFNSILEEISIQNVETIGNYFAPDSRISSLLMPKAKSLGSDFLEYNTTLKDFFAPQVRTMGDYCLVSNNVLMSVNFPELISLGDYFCRNNTSMIQINMPRLRNGGNDIFQSHPVIGKIFEACHNSLDGNDRERLAHRDTRIDKSPYRATTYLIDPEAFEEFERKNPLTASEVGRAAIMIKGLIEKGYQL